MPWRTCSRRVVPTTAAGRREGMLSGMGGFNAFPISATRPQEAFSRAMAASWQPLILVREGRNLRSMPLTDRVKQIMSWYGSDNPGVRANLVRMLNHGPLAGTGKMVILPVDQGFEHGPA